MLASGRGKKKKSGGETRRKPVPSQSEGPADPEKGSCPLVSVRKLDPSVQQLRRTSAALRNCVTDTGKSTGTEAFASAFRRDFYQQLLPFSLDRVGRRDARSRRCRDVTGMVAERFDL